MASTLATPPEAPLPEQPCPLHSPASFGPPMTRCECAGVTFTEVARRMEAEHLPPEQAIGRTRCGQNCGACLPDLQRFLSGR
jgi:bacterioferritin-associated ferredoxin